MANVTEHLLVCLFIYLIIQGSRGTVLFKSFVLHTFLFNLCWRQSEAETGTRYCHNIIKKNTLQEKTRVKVKQKRPLRRKYRSQRTRGGRMAQWQKRTCKLERETCGQNGEFVNYLSIKVMTKNQAVTMEEVNPESLHWENLNTSSG